MGATIRQLWGETLLFVNSETADFGIEPIADAHPFLHAKSRLYARPDSLEPRDARQCQPEPDDQGRAQGGAEPGQGLPRGREPAGLDQGAGGFRQPRPTARPSGSSRKSFWAGGRPMAGWARKPAGRTGRTRRGAGSSIRWTGRRTFCTGCRTGRCRSRWSTRARSSSAVVYRPGQGRDVLGRKGRGLPG